MEGGGPMRGVNCGLFNNLDSNINYSIKNLHRKGLKMNNTYSSLNRCFQKTIWTENI